jgi:hypothetical protein
VVVELQEPPESIPAAVPPPESPDRAAEIDALREEIALLQIALVHARTSEHPLPPALRPALARALLALRGPARR